MEEAIDHELTVMLEAFGNLLKAARIPDDDAEAMARERKDRAPGDLLEVWAEKLVRSGHNALGLISQLKRGALLSDFESLIASVRTVRKAFATEEEQVATSLAAMRTDVQALLSQLEASYYASGHKGPLPQASVSNELASLSQLAAEVATVPAAATVAATTAAVKQQGP